MNFDVNILYKKQEINLLKNVFFYDKIIVQFTINGHTVQLNPSSISTFNYASKTYWYTPLPITKREDLAHFIFVLWVGNILRLVRLKKVKPHHLLGISATTVPVINLLCSSTYFSLQDKHFIEIKENIAILTG